ncbi:MAG: DUF975 family protein [Clostridiales bacterium]|nr:DUF975 family protein [Clostridiales bacterium]
MWTRKELKEKGKKSLKGNFWRCVAAALIIALIGGNATFNPGGSIGAFPKNRPENIETTTEETQIISEETDEVSESDNKLTIDLNGEDTVYEGPALATLMVVFIVSAFVAFLVIMAIGFAVSAFITNPLEVGCRRFFRRNLDEPAALSNIAFAYDNHYMKTVKTMFLRSLYTFFWSLLFIIPGIIKRYEYKMIPYILSEDPTISTEEAFAESKRLMKGNKWKAFVLDLSFIGWDLLSVFTCGILTLFYVDPYKAATDAALYEKLKYGTAA